MPSIAITGGIACGKSLVMNLFAALCSDQKKISTFFDADKEVSFLLDHNAEVIQEISGIFGPEIYNRDGKADRARLRSLLLSSLENKKTA